MDSSFLTYYLLKKFFDFKKIIINGFVTSLQHLVLWGFKCSSQKFRKKLEIYIWNTEVFILQTVLCLCNTVLFRSITTQT